MKVRRTTLYKWMLAYDNIDEFVSDCWFQWKHKQQFGCYQWEAKDRRWYDLIREMPEMVEWSFHDDEVEIRAVDKNGKFITEKVPASEFITSNTDLEPDLEMLWHCGYWDGPLSGVALYNGDVVWFEVETDHGMDDDETDYPLQGLREYSLHELTEEQKMDVVFNHIMFREMVGHHCDHQPKNFGWFTRGKRFDYFYNQWKDNQKKYAHLWDRDYGKGKKLGVFAHHEFKNYGRPKVACTSNNEDNDIK